MTRHAIVLAAGAGRRFGGGKLLALWRGQPLVTWAVRIALAAPVADVVVVVGCRSDKVQEALADLAGPRLRIVEAFDWESGVSASLRSGIAAMPPEAGSVAVFLGDMPSVDPASTPALFEAVESGAVAASLNHESGPAHPIVFGRSLFAELQSVRGDRGARFLLDGRDDVVVLRTEDPGAVYDVDRPQDMNGPTTR